MDKKTIRMGIIIGSILLLSLNVYLYSNDFSLLSNDSMLAQQLIEMTGNENSFHKIISIVFGFIILVTGLFFWNKNQDE